MRRALALLPCLAALALVPAAHAGWFAAEPLDGPGDIQSVAVDLAPDGTGAAVWVKAGAAWVSPLADGAWGTPAALAGPGVTEAVVATGSGGRAVAAWVQNGTAYGALSGQPATPLSAPGGASSMAVDLGVNGVAYAVWVQGGDVRAARLEGSAWVAVPAPLDIDPAAPAGAGAGRPRVAVAADGSAIAVWGETRPDGRTHVFERRVYGTTLSSVPQDATPDLVEGQPAAAADLPDVDVEYDRSFAWVTFRQTVGGRTRSLARRLRASTFEPPVALDGGGTSGEPAVAISGRGVGQTAAITADGQVVGASIRDDLLQPPARLDTVGGASFPRVAFSERDDAVVAWRAGVDPSAVVRARLAPDGEPFQPEVVLSRAGFGTVPPGALAIASDRIADVAVAMLQGPPAVRRVTIAMHDLPPTRPVLTTRSIGPARPRVTWNPGLDLLGPQTFRVLIDGREVGKTAKTSLRAPRRLRAGVHRLQVIAADRRGQSSPPSRSREMRIDARRPRVSVRTTRSARRVRVSVLASDPPGGTGVRRVRVDWGDGTHRSRGRVTSHRYRRRGRYTVVVTVFDRAGNTTVRRMTLRV
jgi:PKD domain